MKQLFSILLLLCTTSMYLRAQNVTNSATGIVKNENDEELPGVSVLAQNASSGFSQTTSTNEKGIFSFKNLPP